MAKLESDFEQLKSDLRCAKGNGWRAVVGTHAGSSAFDDVVREVQRLRRADYDAVNGISDAE